MIKKPQQNRRHLRRRGTSTISRRINWNATILTVLVVMMTLVLFWVVIGVAFFLQRKPSSVAVAPQKPAGSQQEQQETNQQHAIKKRLGGLREPLTLSKDNHKKNAGTSTSAEKIDPEEQSLPFPPKFPTMSRFDSSRSTAMLSQEAIDMCHRTLWHTLESTTIVLPDNETFVHTGDIDDLWLRDSAAQIHPLLVPLPQPEGHGPPRSLVQGDARLQRVVSGLIQRTAWYIRHDPYANAFRIDDTYVFSQAQKEMGRHDFISTWNYELDSACYFMRMVYYFYKAVPQHAVLQEKRVFEAIQIMVDVWIAEQHHEDDNVARGALLDCQNCNKPYRYPGLPRNGKGSATQYTGMTWSAFRPSDDECRYGYLIPANMFAVVVLQYMMELCSRSVWKDLYPTEAPALIAKMQKLKNEIQQGIETYGVVKHENHGKIYAYEVDGLGNSLLMDDANVPSLMSIAYLGYDYDEQVYAATKQFILSQDNPTFASGTNPETDKFIQSYGSPHMAARIRKNVWPMALAMEGLVTSSITKKLELIETLVESTGGTGWMHESFDVNHPKRFTRSWFCWADSLFAELVMSVTDKCPSPAAKKYKILSWRDPNQVEGGPYAHDQR